MTVWRKELLLAITAAVVLVACNPFRRGRTPKPPSIVVAPPPKPKPTPEPKVLDAPDPPKVEQPPVSSIPPLPEGPVPQPPKPEVKKPRPRRTGSRPRPAKEPEKVGPVVVPQLGELLTDEKREQISGDLDEFLKRIDANLKKLAGRNLNSDQRLTRDRVNALAQQARETRDVHPATARALAETADLLAGELERTSR